MRSLIFEQQVETFPIQYGMIIEVKTGRKMRECRFCLMMDCKIFNDVLNWIDINVGKCLLLSQVENPFAGIVARMVTCPKSTIGKRMQIVCNITPYPPMRQRERIQGKTRITVQLHLLQCWIWLKKSNGDCSCNVILVIWPLINYIFLFQTQHFRGSWLVL